MKRTDQEAAEAKALAKSLIRAAGGPRQLAMQTIHYGNKNLIAADVPKQDVAAVSQWGQRGIPYKIMFKHKDVFAALEKKLKAKS